MFAIIAIISDVLNIINVLIIATGAPGDAAEDMYNNNPYNAIGYGIGIIVAAISYYGALKYNVNALAVNIAYIAIWCVIVVVTTIMASPDVGTVIGIIVWAVLFSLLAMYPAIFLIKEIKAGIMTPETYPREAHSCCCSPKV